MAEFVLVHGSWHGAWCWREVAARLEVRGHKVAAIDLPAHGADPADPETVTLQDYVNRVIEAVDRSKAPPLVVGHSMGLIGLVAEQAPERIRALV